MEIRIDDDVRKFLTKLEKSTLAKTLRIIDLLEQYGLSLPMPYSRILQRNMYELRVRGVQEVRFIYTIQGSIVYIVHGFIKKTQKIPPKELFIAKQRIRHLKHT